MESVLPDRSIASQGDWGSSPSRSPKPCSNSLVTATVLPIVAAALDVVEVVVVELTTARVGVAAPAGGRSVGKLNGRGDATQTALDTLMMLGWQINTEKSSLTRTAARLPGIHAYDEIDPDHLSPEGETHCLEEGHQAPHHSGTSATGDHSQTTRQDPWGSHRQLSSHRADADHDAAPLLLSAPEDRVGVTDLPRRRRDGGTGVVARQHQGMKVDRGYRRNSDSDYDTDYGCVYDRLGCDAGGSGNGTWLLPTGDPGQVVELQGTLRRVPRTLRLQGENQRSTHPPLDRQHHDDVLHQWPGRTTQTPQQADEAHLLGSEGMPYVPSISSSPRGPQHPRGRTISPQPRDRVEPTAGDLSATREPLGFTHSGPLRHQQLPRYNSRFYDPQAESHGRHDSELEGREQLHMPPLENAEPDRQQDQTGELRCDPHRPIVALSSVVSHTAALKLRFVLHQQPEHPPSTLLGKRRAAEKQQVETSSLQDIWQEHANDWDIETRALLADSLRPSTLHSYDGVLKRFDRFCTDNYSYFPKTTAAVAHFLRDISSKSTRPGPSLITASAAIAGMYKGSLLNDPTKSQLLSMLKQAIVNTGTKQPRKNTPTFPINKLTHYISELAEDSTLDVKTLRTKAIVLLALVGLFRPSDLERIKLTHLNFSSNSVIIVNFGGKTDKDMAGIPTTIKESSSALLCPYVHSRTTFSGPNRTVSVSEKPVFLYLNGKHPEPLGKQRIAKIMTRTLQAAGIDDTTARSFRKSGASAAINKGTDPDLVMKLGRWKSVDIFFINTTSTGTRLISLTLSLGTDLC